MSETTPYYDEGRRGLVIEPDRPESEARPFTEAEKRWQTVLIAVDSGLSLPESSKAALALEQFNQPSAEEAQQYLRILDTNKSVIESYSGLIKAYAKLKETRHETHPERASELMNAKTELSTLLNSPEVIGKASEFARLYLEEQMRKHDLLFADEKTSYEAMRHAERMENFVDKLKRLNIPVDENTRQAWEKIQRQYTENLKLKLKFINQLEMADKELATLEAGGKDEWTMSMAETLTRMSLRNIKWQLERPPQERMALPPDAQQQYEKLLARFEKLSNSEEAKTVAA